MKNDIITIAHGGGGTRTQRLIRDVFLKHLRNPILDQLDDSASLHVPETELAFTTDSYVVNPLFFPGGDIGALSVCGTVNDLVMQGAAPKYMSLGLILEEGFAIDDLERIIQSIAAALQKTNVTLATGDTKVVERGKGNGVFINTSGIGIREPGVNVHVSNARPGDVIIISGTVGDHGIAVMSQREGLRFQSSLVSDVAPLDGLILPLMREIPDLHVLRDPTRGGVAAALCDIAQASQAGITIEETCIPVKKEVIGACNLLGFDPLHVANEGKALIVCAEQDAAHACALLNNHPLGKDAAVIGAVVSEHNGTVIESTAIGGERIVEMTTGEDLPRIC
jgi:hydrogenase expression/formation protein HypE